MKTSAPASASSALPGKSSGFVVCGVALLDGGQVRRVQRASIAPREVGADDVANAGREQRLA